MLVIRSVRRVGGAVRHRGPRRVPGRPLAALLLVLGLCGAALPQQPLDIDTADAQALAAALPGIGPVKARRIVEHRERHGPFGGIDGLAAVKGIGPVTLERIRAHLAGAASIGQPAPASADGEVAGPGGGARSSTELERAAREAVRAVVDAARRDARPYRQ